MIRSLQFRRNPVRGMTFIEVMVCVVLMAVLMGVAFPTMSGINRKNKLRAAARELVAISKAARAEAVFGERTTSLVLDVDKHEYFLVLRTPEEELSTAEKFTGGGGKSRAKTRKDRLEQPRELKSFQVVFDEVSAYDENILDDKKIVIDFHADGSASPTLFSLKNTKDERITIEIMKATGQVEISPGTVEEKQAKIMEAAGNVGAPPPPAAGGGGAV